MSNFRDFLRKFEESDGPESPFSSIPSETLGVLFHHWKEQLPIWAEKLAGFTGKEDPNKIQNLTSLMSAITNWNWLIRYELENRGESSLLEKKKESKSTSSVEVPDELPETISDKSIEERRNRKKKDTDEDA
ncbi:MAG: hypothetical protein ACXABY_29865 [Candidatus Thorarchaeota archaeon]|jgi:hypothetical protein